jgi:hypothetical protein
MTIAGINRFARRALAALGLALGLGAAAGSAEAAPQARILRVDPRAAQQNGSPVLTSVIEVSQSKRVSDATVGCAGITGNAQLDCMSQSLERPFALYTPFPFPSENAIFTVSIEGTEFLAKYVSHSQWGESQQLPGVGTAWLILIDADKRMGRAFEDARQVAQQLVASLGPNDIVDVMFFNDRQIVKDSKWLAGAQKSAAQFIAQSSETFAASGRNRSLLTIIKTAATDGFGSLGNVGEDVKVPLHQALVVLSSGFGGTDPATTGPGALQLQQYLTGGRFPEENTALPKSPVPVISVYFPVKTFDEFKQNSLEFMQNLANTEIGGFFTVVQEGQGGRAPAIVSTVRQRFSKMNIVKWRASCVAPSVTQSFKLFFNNMKTPLLGDNTFKDVPVGIDPTTWPLDVNKDYSQEMAKRGAVYPGGRFRVYGDFCWGGDKSRAEAYFLPAGQPLPTALSGTDIEQAKRTQQQLIAMGMKGSVIEASDSYVEVEAPDKDRILHGSGEQAVVRIVLYDNRARRTSGVTADSIIQLKGTTPPLNLMLILGSAFGAVVLALLVVVILRSGGKKRGGTPPPQPIAAGYGGPPGYGAAQGYGGPQGYGAPQPGYSPPAQPPGPNPEFLYGAPGQAAGLAVGAPAPQAAPANPYGAAPGGATSATIQGSAGLFTLLPGQELRAGRDAAQCGIVLSEPRVSGVHATLKLENGQLFVRDENSNNGTLVNGNRVSPGIWSPVPAGSILRFGPVEFSARLG